MPVQSIEKVFKEVRLSNQKTSGVGDVMVLLRMGQPNATAHLEPLAAALAPHRLHVVRPAPRPVGLVANNVRYWEVRGRSRVLQVLKVLYRGLLNARRLNINIVLSFNAYPYGVLAAIVSKATNKPLHVGYVGSDLEQLKRRRWWLPFVRRAIVATVPGPALANRLSDAGYGGLVVPVPHGVDTQRFQPFGDRDLDCLFVGALSKVKRVDLVLGAMALVTQQRPQSRMVVIGSGPLSSSLKALNAELGLSQMVEFVGYQDRPEEWMRRARVIIFPSEWEGLPYAMIEAMRCGVVPIASPVGAVRDLIEDGRNGRLIDDRSPKRVSSIILEVLEDEEALASMSEQAVLSTSEYTYESVTERWRLILATFGNALEWQD